MIAFAGIISIDKFKITTKLVCLYEFYFCIINLINFIKLKCEILEISRSNISAECFSNIQNRSVIFYFIIESAKIELNTGHLNKISIVSTIVSKYYSITGYRLIVNKVSKVTVFIDFNLKSDINITIRFFNIGRYIISILCNPKIKHFRIWGI